MASETSLPCLSRRSILAGAAGMLALAGASAQVYPSRPLRVVVPAPAGSPPDVIARLWGEQFAKMSGQPAVIDNRPGASTIIATQGVVGGLEDGYTVLYTFNTTFSINPFVFKKLPYKADDFIPVVRLLSVPYVLVVSAGSRFRTLQDLIREAKAAPQALTYGSPGIATGNHVSMARLLKEAGVTMTHVPYKDYFMPDLIAQRLDAAFDVSTGAIPHIKGGRVRALAVSSAERIEALPDVPTVAESLTGFLGDSWHGLFVKKGTPSQVVASLAEYTGRIIAMPEFRKALRDFSLTPVGGTSEQFREFLMQDARTWATTVKDNNITAE